MDFKKRLYKDYDRLKKNYKLLILSIFTIYFYSCMTNLVYYLHVQDERLYDILFNIFPESKLSGKIADILTMLYLIYFILFIFFPYYYKRTFIMSSEIIILFLKVYIITTYLRCISFLFTILPSPAKHCQNGSEEYNKPTFVEIFTRLDMFTGCGDLIFSGHTNIIVVITLNILYFLKPVMNSKIYFLYVIMTIIYNITLFILIIFARNHYTVDIVVGIYVSILVFYMVVNNFRLKKVEKKYKINIIEMNDIENERNIENTYLKNYNYL